MSRVLGFRKSFLFSPRRSQGPQTGLSEGVVLWVVFLVCCTNVNAEDVIEIGSRRELFVDHYLISEMKGLELKLHHPTRAAPAQNPLPVGAYATVIRDDRNGQLIYRAYWRSGDPGYKGETYTGHPGELVRYAESADGREWTFPKLGLCEIEGSTANNVILARMPPLLTNFTPFLDARQGVPAAERFKALAGYPGPGDKRGQSRPGMGLFMLTSADGIHWAKGKEVIPYQPEWRHAFDSQNVSFWSNSEQKYVCYFRTWTSPERLRTISRTTSPDFRTWTRPVSMNPNLPGEHLYTNQTHPYFRAPHIYIALPTRYVRGRGGAPRYDLKDRNATDILLMTSRAGREHYDRTFPEAFIRPGLDPKRWGNRANYAALNVVPTSPTEMSIYHRSGDRYVMRTDGFISVHAGATAGELVTRPISFQGRSLEVNFNTGAAGVLKVEFQTVDGNPIPGFTLEECSDTYGDHIQHHVHWSGDGDVKALAGKPVRIRFQLQECDLYSFRFTKRPNGAAQK